MVGTIDSPWLAVVDDRGRLAAGRAWTLDWWVGAEDRWHRPDREVAVRQRLVEGTPVVETAMRVPGGDIVHQVYGTRVGGVEVVVIEVENRTAVPVALALAVAGEIGEVVQEEAGLVVDGELALVWSKPPGRAAAVEGDVEPVVTGGGAGTGPVRVRSRRRRASAALVWPLAHRTSLRFLVPDPGATTAPSGAVPSAEQVVRGWQVHAGRGIRTVLPDPAVQSAIDAGRGDALLRHASSCDPAVAVALDHAGLPEEAAGVLRRIADQGHGDLVEALAVHWRLHRDRELAVELAPVVAAAAERAARRGARSWLRSAALLLRAAGEDRAADDADRLAGGAPASEPAWSHPLSIVRRQLVSEHHDGLVLCSDWPAAWLGAGIEVHDAPTAAGVLSFAVRWHGERPALLWELEPWPGEPPTRLRVPGLDGSWSSSDGRGEALLAAVPRPGVPVTLRRS